MGSDPAEGLGGLYISATDGFVEHAELVSDTHLACRIDAAVTDATTSLYSRTRPVKVTVNGRPETAWTYDESQKILAIQTSGLASIDVFLK